MTKKEIIKLIKTTLKSIEDYMDVIGGIDITDPILKSEKYLYAILDYAEIKGTRINKEHKENITNSVNFIVSSISTGISKHLKSIDNNSIYIKQVQDKTEKTYGYFNITSPINGDVIKIAKIPFLIWACGDTPYQYGQEHGDIIWDLKLKLIDMWGKTISCSGEKMRNDNEYHSEWIRSMGVIPESFYELVKDNDKKWINDFAFSFSGDFIRDEILEEGFNIENFLNEITDIDENIDDRFHMTKSLLKRENKKDIEKENILQSIPYNINPNSSFPIYFNPLFEREGKLEDFVKTTCVVVENSDESINEIALELCDYNNSIIFTKNASKTAHLINISKDLQLNIFHLPSNVKLSYDKMYKLEKNGKITLVLDGEYDIPGIALQNCENNKNFYKQNMSKKVSNLAKCYNNGINVPNGFFKNRTNIPKITNPIQMIARSAGSTENGNNASFSGIFKSKVLDINSLDNNKLNILEVINSFHSPIAKKYAMKMNVKLPKVGVFYQEYIKADKSFVVKLNNENLYIEMVNDSAEVLVNGTAKEIKSFEFDDINNIENDSEVDLSNLIQMIADVSFILKEKELEFEIIEQNKILYLVQVV